MGVVLPWAHQVQQSGVQLHDGARAAKGAPQAGGRGLHQLRGQHADMYGPQVQQLSKLLQAGHRVGCKPAGATMAAEHLALVHKSWRRDSVHAIFCCQSQGPSKYRYGSRCSAHLSCPWLSTTWSSL